MALTLRAPEVGDWADGGGQLLVSYLLYWMHFGVQPIHVLGILMQVRIHIFVRLKGTNSFVLEKPTLFLIREARL